MRGKGQAPAWLLLAVVGCLPAAGQDWSGNGFERAEARRLTAEELAVEPGEVEIDRSLPLTLIRLQGSNWTDARVVRQVRNTAAILRQCGIGLGPVTLAEAKAPGGRHDVSMEMPEGAPAPEDVVTLAALPPPQADWPRVFFAGRLLNDEAVARSFRRGAVAPEEAGRYPYMNTVWVAFKAHWMERKDDGYSSLAHELMHLLCECGHEPSDQRHLLHPYRNFLSTDILPQHCEAARGSSLLHDRARAADSRD